MLGLSLFVGFLQFVIKSLLTPLVSFPPVFLFVQQFLLFDIGKEGHFTLTFGLEFV